MGPWFSCLAWKWVGYTAGASQGTNHQWLFYSRYLLNEGTTEKKRTSLLNVHGHGFTFSFKSISFHSSSKGVEGQRMQLFFTFIKWENNTHPSYLQIQMVCLFNFILYQWFGSFVCTLESSRSFKPPNVDMYIC